MEKDIAPNGLTKTLVVIVIIVHLLFFVLESVLWMNPIVYHQLLNLLNNPVGSGYELQALTLKKLFVNQGFYNLFLAFGGLAGLYLLKKSRFIAGYSLLIFVCFSASGAGIVLALTSKAYVLALFQLVPGAIAGIRLYTFYRLHS